GPSPGDRVRPVPFQTCLADPPPALLCPTQQCRGPPRPHSTPGGVQQRPHTLTCCLPHRRRTHRHHRRDLGTARDGLKEAQHDLFLHQGDGLLRPGAVRHALQIEDRTSTRLHSSHVSTSYAVF